jgi:polyhydroxybutyrate depolymerase
MAHRLTCERPDLFASIVAVAGSIDPDRDCSGDGTTSVLSIHGTADQTINYEGGATYPSAPETAAAWATDLECGAGADGDPLDLDTLVEGSETATKTYEGCRGGATVALWTVAGAGHQIAFPEDVAKGLWRWLTVHATS